MSTIRTIVVDDFEPFRRYICSLLKRTTRLQVVGDASDGLEAVQKAEELKPDLILLDIGLPSLNGIEAYRRISKIVPGAKIVFVTQINDADVVLTVLGNSPTGYVLKLDAGSDLLAAVDAVLEGKQFVSTGVRHLVGADHSCQNEALRS